MIIKSAVRGNGGKLADYLLNEKKNERVEIAEVRGWDLPRLKDAFRMSEEIALSATQCKKPFYHVSFRAAPGETLTPEQWHRCADRLEQRLGLVGHSRALVLHTYQGETHLHAVWDRVDEHTLKAVNLHQEHRACMATARALERELGLQQVQETKRSRAQDQTPDATLAPARFPEEQQARRARQDLAAIRSAIREAWDQSDNGAAFAAALEAQGLLLAQGDRRDYVALDAQGGVYSIGKRTTGAPARAVREKLADLDRDRIPTVEQGRAQLAAREQARAQARTREAAREHWLAAAREELEQGQARAREKAQARQEARERARATKREREAALAANEARQEPARAKGQQADRREEHRAGVPARGTDTSKAERGPGTATRPEQDAVRLPHEAPGERDGPGAPTTARAEQAGQRVTHGQPTAALDVRHEETRQHGGITATDQLVEPEQPRNEPREERNARDATPHGNRDGHGIKVIDSATGVATGLSSGVALILDTIAKPAEGIIEGIANMFGASPAPPQPARTTRERLQRRAAVNKAMRNISQSVQRGDDLNAADLRVLPPVELERIRDGGDEYLMRLVQRFERERAERGRERER